MKSSVFNFFFMSLSFIWLQGLRAQKTNIEKHNFDSLIKTIKVDTLKIDCAFNYALGAVNKDSVKYFKAYQFGFNLLKKYPNYKYGKALQLYTQMNYYAANEVGKALPYADSIIAIVAPVQSKKYGDLRVRCLIDKGYTLSLMANDDEAIMAYQQAIDLGKYYGLNRRIAIAFNNIAGIYANKQVYNEQLRLMKQALYYIDVPDETGYKDKDKFAFFCLTISSAFYQLKQYDSVDLYLAKAKKYIFPEHDDNLTIYYYFILGNLESAKDNIALSNSYYIKGLEIAKQVNNVNRQLQLIVSIGSNFIHEKDYQSAINYFKKAEQYCYESNNSAQLIEVYRILYDSYKQINNKSNSYYYLDKYFILSDSLKIQENTENFAELEKKYSLKMKDQELNYFKDLNAVNQKSIFQNRVIIGTLVGLFLLGIFFTIFYLRQQKLVHIKNQEIAQLKLSEAASLSQIEKAKAILETQEEERTRIAKDLHDEVGGTLAALKLKLQNNNLNVNNHTAVDIVDQLARNVRQISHNMMPDAIEKFGLKNALAGYISKLNMQSDTVFKFQMDALDLIKFGESREVAIYRIVQEVLTNALKHAKAKVVYVQMYESDGELSISIEDDGAGFQHQNMTEGIGMKNINSRVNFLSGTIEYQSQSNKGTSVQINIPII
jgi:two-component system, NarL family, sensor kinase